MRPDSFDYESHKDWAERVQPPVRREPWRPNGALVAVASVLALLGVVVIVSYVFLITGVLVWR